MSDLTDFLLARLDDDERDIRKLAMTDRRPVLSLARTVNHPERLLLECEAKRRIVELCRWTDRGQKYLELHDGEASEWEILCALSLPYRDHPDHDPAWAPTEGRQP